MSSDESNVFDPNKIDPSLEVHDIVTGGNGGNFAYAIAAPHNGKELTVFKFSAQDEDPICAARYAIALPSEVNVEIAKFAASYAYTANLIFMTRVINYIALILTAEEQLNFILMKLIRQHR